MEAINVVMKNKVVFIMGATGTGKSKLSIDIGTHFPAEIINCDKIQMYKGLDIITNKVPESERQNLLHHLLGNIENPNSDFTAQNFCEHALQSITKILGDQKTPIICGGSNSFIEFLVDDPILDFLSSFECCFLWIDVSLPVLYEHVSNRVDEMVAAGLVDEAREIYVPEADYSRGIRRAIGVPEMEKYFEAETTTHDEIEKKKVLEECIQEIKDNTCKLACRQIEKIQRLRNEVGWKIHRIDATGVIEKFGKDRCEAWEKDVLKPCLAIVGEFLEDGGSVGIESYDESSSFRPQFVNEITTDTI